MTDKVVSINSELERKAEQLLASTPPGILLKVTKKLSGMGEFYIGRTFENVSAADFQTINRKANSRGLMASLTAIDSSEDGEKFVSFSLVPRPADI